MDVAANTQKPMPKINMTIDMKKPAVIQPNTHAVMARGGLPAGCLHQTIVAELITREIPKRTYDTMDNVHISSE